MIAYIIICVAVIIFTAHTPEEWDNIINNIKE